MIVKRKESEKEARGGGGGGGWLDVANHTVIREKFIHYYAK